MLMTKFLSSQMTVNGSDDMRAFSVTSLSFVICCRFGLKMLTSVRVLSAADCSHSLADWCCLQVSSRCGMAHLVQRPNWEEDDSTLLLQAMQALYTLSCGTPITWTFCRLWVCGYSGGSSLTSPMSGDNVIVDPSFGMVRYLVCRKVRTITLERL